MVEFPEFMQRVMGGLDFEMPACIGPVRYKDLDAVRADIANLKAALDGADVEDAFMSAASPGVIAVFLQNQHYDSHEDYVFALAEAMKPEYDEIHKAGIVLQLDCPDLAMTRQMMMRRVARGVPRPRARQRRGAQPRDRATSRPRTCACTSAGATTRARTTTTSRCATSSTSSSRRGRRRSRSRRANPRHEHEWNVFEDVKLPEGKVLIPGRARLDDELHRAPRARRPAPRPLRAGSSAART